MIEFIDVMHECLNGYLLLGLVFLMWIMNIYS